MSDNKQLILGPCWILTAPSLEDPVDKWFNLGYTREPVTLQISPSQIRHSRVDQLGAIPLLGTGYLIPESAVIGASLTAKDIDTMLKVIPGASRITPAEGTDVLSLSSGVEKMTARAFALVPIEDFEEGEPWWKSGFAAYLRNAYVNVDNEFHTNSLPEDDDLNDYAVTFTEVKDPDKDRMHFMGDGYKLSGPVENMVGFNDPDSMSFGVPEADTLAALNGAGYNTMRDLTNEVGAIDLSTQALTDPAGLEYAINCSGLDVSDNNISQALMSDFVHELWLNRELFGSNNCVIDLSLNNGLSAKAQNEVDDLVAAGCTVTT